MKVVRHENKFVEEKTFLRTIAGQSIEKQARERFGLKN